MTISNRKGGPRNVSTKPVSPAYSSVDDSTVRQRTYAGGDGRISLAVFAVEQTTKPLPGTIRALNELDKAAGMDIKTNRARVTGPVSYLDSRGRKRIIPIGPCLLESQGGRSIDIIWGARGQNCVALPVEVIEAAREHGHLMLLQ